MASRDRDRGRKYISGAEKLKTKKQRDGYIKQQTNNIMKFVIETTGHSRQPNEDEEHLATYQIPLEEGKQQLNTPVKEEQEDTNETEMDENENNRTTSDCETHREKDIEDMEIEAQKEENRNFDTEDPSTWPIERTQQTVNLIVQHGPVQVNQFNFPKNKNKRSFSATYFTRILANGQRKARRWLIYSKSKDKVYCFACKLFSITDVSLGTDGFCDWSHLSQRIKMHEQSAVHLQAINKWFQTEQNFRIGNLIDKEFEKLLKLETARCEQVFQRITAIILYLAQHNLAFRGSSDTLNTPHNGNFLDLIQLVAKFDSVLNDHLNRTAIKGHHYLSHSIQNELISAMVNKVQRVIIDAIKRAKYYSILLDCTPDVSHQEQLSVVLRYVNITDDDVEIEEHFFIKFEIVHNTTGKGLSETIILILDQLGIKISDCRGQGYDNGANMRGIYQGVQANILCENHKAFYVSCGSHNLNLLLRDIAKSSTQALNFFGVLHKIYTIFAASTSRWDVLKKHVEKVTPKPLSETRWECRFDSVRAVRFQVRQFRNALNEVANNASDNKLKIEILSTMRKINEFEFIASLIIWYEILSKINIVSKVLQNQKMQIDLATKHLKGLNVFLVEYRNAGFNKAMIAANEVAKELDIAPDFKSSYRGKNGNYLITKDRMNHRRSATKNTSVYITF
ncbi:zinc finger MYM-type protein 1-like [Osmia bicornis bicornis]|uniref:zinc finger MYM-type protein 1-like n=1 Tax=Osmia bicornis bicornis TaxID=1437191 RepID=UPI001EAED81F|nr:zinc finger MYM-type protein 1-like [Osmia bicornis bicornis]